MKMEGREDLLKRGVCELWSEYEHLNEGNMLIQGPEK